MRIKHLVIRTKIPVVIIGSYYLSLMSLVNWFDYSLWNVHLLYGHSQDNPTQQYNRILIDIAIFQIYLSTLAEVILISTVNIYYYICEFDVVLSDQRIRSFDLKTYSTIVLAKKLFSHMLFHNIDTNITNLDNCNFTFAFISH